LSSHRLLNPPDSGRIPSARRARPSTRTPGAHPAPSPSGRIPSPSGRFPAGPPTPSGRLPAAHNRIGEFMVDRVLGRGAMGAVYAARDSLGRMVALKQVHPQHLDANGLARFRREGQALAALKSHPNVVGVHALGMAHKGPYLVMDLVPGETLKDLLHRNPPSVERAVEIVAGLAEGVSHLHHAGVIHRDLKPANVLIREGDGTPVITDFGLARKSGDERLTQTGEVLGTPLYMSPEQLRGLQLDERADVWALGAILYELLTGRTPFLGKTLLELAQASVSPPPRVRSLAPHVDATLAGVVERALCLDREERWSSADALAASLRAYVRYSEGNGPPPRRRASRLASSMLLPLLGSFLLALLGVGGLSYVLLSGSEPDVAATPPPPDSATAPETTPPPELPDPFAEARAEVRAGIEARDWERSREALVGAGLPPAELKDLRDAALLRALEQQPSSLRELTAQVQLLHTFALEGAPVQPAQVAPIVDWSALNLIDPAWRERDPQRVAEVWIGSTVQDLCQRMGDSTTELGPLVDLLELLPQLGLPLGNRAKAEVAMDDLVGYQVRDVEPYVRRVAAALTALGVFVQSDFLRLQTIPPGSPWRVGTPAQRLLYWRLRSEEPDETAFAEILALATDPEAPDPYRAQAARQVLDWHTHTLGGVLDPTRLAAVNEAAALDLESPFLALGYVERTCTQDPERARWLTHRALLTLEDHHARSMTLNWSLRSLRGRAAVIFARLGEREQSLELLESNNTADSHSYREDALACYLALGEPETCEGIVRELVAELAQARREAADDVIEARKVRDCTEQLAGLRGLYLRLTGEPLPAEWLRPPTHEE